MVSPSLLSVLDRYGRGYRGRSTGRHGYHALVAALGIGYGHGGGGHNGRGGKLSWRRWCRKR